MENNGDQKLPIGFALAELYEGNGILVRNGQLTGNVNGSNRSYTRKWKGEEERRYYDENDCSMDV